MLQVKTLALYLFFAMSTWIPPRDQGVVWHEPESHATGRYYDFAVEVSRVALDPAEFPIDGLSDDDEEARARTALLLTAIASFESAFAEPVVTCAKLGPGAARGPFQCEGPRCADVCLDVTHAARVALSMAGKSFSVCSALDLRDRLSVYTDGACRRGWARSRTRVARAERWWRARSVRWAESLLDDWGDITI